MFKKVYLILIFTLVFSGCSSSRTDDDSFFATKGVEVFDFEFGVYGFESEKITLVYNGQEKLNLDAYFRNGPDARSIGLMVFIDGIMQECNLYSHDETMYIIQMEPYESKDVNINFVPNTGHIDDVLNIYIIAIINPDYVPAQNGFVSMGSNLHMAQINPGEVHFKANAKETDNEYSYELAYIDSLSENEGRVEDFQIIPNEFSHISIRRNNPWSLTIQGTAAAYVAKYRVCVFLNHRIIDVFNGEPYLDVELIPGKVAEAELLIDESDLHNENTIFAIAFPLDLENRAIRSNAMAIFISD